MNTFVRDDRILLSQSTYRELLNAESISHGGDISEESMRTKDLLTYSLTYLDGVHWIEPSTTSSLSWVNIGWSFSSIKTVKRLKSQRIV